MKNKEIRGVLQFIDTNTGEDFYIPLSNIKYIKTSDKKLSVYIKGTADPVTVERSNHNIGGMYEWLTFKGGIV